MGPAAVRAVPPLVLAGIPGERRSVHKRTNEADKYNHLLDLETAARRGTSWLISKALRKTPPLPRWSRLQRPLPSRGQGRRPTFLSPIYASAPSGAEDAR